MSVVGAGVNLILSVLKIFTGYFSYSQALLVDGIHSLSDLLSDVLVWFAAEYATDAPDEEHPYGHERFETLATLALAVLLLLVGLGVLIDSVSYLFVKTQPLKHNVLLLSVIIISVLSKELLYWYSAINAKKVGSSMLKANAWHHRSDALSSVIVLVGVLGTLAGYFYLDAIAALIVGAMILYIAYKLGLPCVRELLDTALDKKTLENLRAHILKIDGVKNIHSLRTRLSGRRTIIDVHIEVNPFLSVSEGHAIAIDVENTLKQNFANLVDVVVHIDPEKDEVENFYTHLPRRKVVMNKVYKLLNNHDCLKDLDHIQLHYLKGQIHIDFYFYAQVLNQQNNYDHLHATLTNIINSSDIFGNMHLYFSKQTNSSRGIVNHV